MALQTEVAWFDLKPTGGSPSPSTSTAGSMVFDAANGNIVLFGGSSDRVGNSTTWIFDGRVWTKMNPPHSPGPREEAAMAYFPGVGVVLFGGWGGGQNALFYNDTWRWDGRDWTILDDGTGPSARTGAAMAYNPVVAGGSRGMILYGGQNVGLTSAAAKETWLLQFGGIGSPWSLQVPAHNPGERIDHTMSIASNGLVRLWAGHDIGSGSQFTSWDWTGSDWTQSGIAFHAGNLAGGAFHTNLNRVIWTNPIFSTGNDTYFEDANAFAWTQATQTSNPLIWPLYGTPAGTQTLPYISGALTAADLSGNVTALAGSSTFQLRIVPGLHADMHWATGGYAT